MKNVGAQKSRREIEIATYWKDSEPGLNFEKRNLYVTYYWFMSWTVKHCP
jgi:hypothetical protein